MGYKIGMPGDPSSVSGQRRKLCAMTPTAAELLRSAKALPLDERAELAQELLASLSTHDAADQVRLAALQAAVAEGIASLDAGEGIEIPAGELREYLRERGRIATERASASTA